MKVIEKSKKFQSILNSQESEVEALAQEIALKQKILHKKKQLVEDFKQKVDRIKVPKETVVSEHAILRYLERVKGMDLNEIKREIYSDEVKSLVEKLGTSGEYPNGNFSVVMRNNVIITVKTN